MKVSEMKARLSAHGVEDGDLYTHGSLGGGEIDGIEQVDGKWFTYFSERGRKRNYREWPSEEEAVAYIYERAERLARRLGLWKG